MNARTRSVVVAGYLLLCILIGGSWQGVWRNLVLQFLGVALIAWAALFPSQRANESERPGFLYVLLGLAGLLALLQLIPLPPEVWTNLPGRSAIVGTFRLLGGELPALPVSVAPYRSVMTLFAVIPGLALLIAVKMLRPSPAWLALAVVVGMAGSIAVGAVQVAGGSQSWAYLYPYTNAGAVGTFANRNHMATLLLVSIPFAAALLASSPAERSGAKQSRMAIGLAALALVAVGIALNGSMAAIALVVPVLLASAALIPAAGRWRKRALPVAAAAVAAAIVMLAMNPVGGASNTGAGESVQQREAIWAITAQAISDYFPFGSGLGTFSLVYRQYEDPSAVVPDFVNHAHNDYLELALELGLPGALLLLLFLGWWALTAVRIWMSPFSTTFARAATIASGVILAHAIVDYPLRTGAVAAVFGAAIALMAQRRRSEEPSGGEELRPTRHVELG